VDITKWNERYRSGERSNEDLNTSPTPVLVSTIGELPTGNALDLACGAGRNALWLARRGWQVTAVDGADTAVEILRERVATENLPVTAVVADLEGAEFTIQPETWDLIVMSFYLQRSLFEHAMSGLKSGGLLLAVVHVTRPGEEPNEHRVGPGELRQLFNSWPILHEYEGPSRDVCHRRPVAEIVVRKPG